MLIYLNCFWGGGGMVQQCQHDAVFDLDRGGGVKRNKQYHVLSSECLHNGDRSSEHRQPRASSTPRRRGSTIQC